MTSSEKLEQIAESRYWIVVSFFILLHFVVAFSTVHFFPIVGIEEPGYTIPAFNLAQKGQKVNEFFKDCGYDPGWTSGLDRKIFFSPLFHFLLGGFIQIFSYDLIYLRLLSSLAGGLFLFVFARFSKTYLSALFSLSALLFIETNILFRFVSQEARPDIWVALSSLLAFSFLGLYLQNKKFSSLFGVSIFAAATLLLHVFGIVVFCSIYATLFFYVLKREITIGQWILSFLISSALLMPYVVDVLVNFPLFKIQMLHGALSLTKQVLVADPFSILLLGFFLLVGIICFGVKGQEADWNYLRILFLSLVVFVLVFTFRFRYTFIILPLCVIILMTIFQGRISQSKCLLSCWLIIGINLIFTFNYLLPMAQSSESYWETTQRINPLIRAKSRIIGHPLIQWGLDPKKKVRIFECVDVKRINLGDFDYVIADRYFQDILASWPPETKSRLDLIYDDDSRIYNWKVFQIKNEQFLR